MRSAILVAVCAGLTACGGSGDPIGALELLERKVARGAATDVDVQITMHAGDLLVTSGAEGLLEGRFRFRGEAGRPDLRYDDSPARGKLRLRPTRETGDASVARWDLRLAEKLPLDLNVHMGAGRAQLELGALDLRGVTVHGGAGDLMLDLRGRPERDYDVELHGGVGRMRIYLPGRAAVRAQVSGGIGGVETEGGWVKSGREYRSANYGTGRPRIDLRVHGGIGTIKLIADE